MFLEKRRNHLQIIILVLFLVSGCVGVKEIVPSNEPPLTQTDLLKPVPDFLTAGQQNLYLRALKFYNAANAADTSAIDSAFEGETYESYETYKQGTNQYLISRGRYKNWEDFTAVVDSLFTSQGYQTSIRQIFLECDGKLCFIDAGKGSGMTYNKNFTDEFELLEQTDEMIRFNVIGHYSQLYPLKDETNEQQNKRLNESFEYTQRFPITLVLTEKGWRFEEFHDTFTDQGDYTGKLIY